MWERFELALLTVKTYQNSVAIPAMTPMVGPETVCFACRTAIDSYTAAAGAFGQPRVMPGAVYIEAGLDGPGVVRQAGGVVRVVFGEPDGSLSQRGRNIADAFNDCGVPAELTADIRAGLWAKFLFIATMAGVTSLAGRPWPS